MPARRVWRTMRRQRNMLRRMLGFVTIGCLCTSAWAAGADGLDSYIQHEMEAQKIPGVAFAVIDYGKIVEERAYGRENLETGTPLRTHGVFEIASVTKPFTATEIMLLVQDGKIRLDDPIDKYIDYASPPGKRLRCALLSHTSGIKGLGWVESMGRPAGHHHQKVLRRSREIASRIRSRRARRIQ